YPHASRQVGHDKGAPSALWTAPWLSTGGQYCAGDGGISGPNFSLAALHGSLIIRAPGRRATLAEISDNLLTHPPVRVLSSPAVNRIHTGGESDAPGGVH